MNNKKICFITCVNNDRKYEECLLYINNLIIPEGYEIDCISIREAESITSGYNAAMKSTDAKYKVYLHQDTYIINKNFIYDMLDIYNLDSTIGMIGVAGTKTIPTNAIWWESMHKYGKVYDSHTGSMELLDFNNVEKNYEEVKTVHGLIMITQYDLHWREDIFGGWYFYDVSQSVEFTLSGYKVVVPKQSDCWCVHDCGLINTSNRFDEYRNIFLNEYSKKIFPLVSILIPTYNRPKYFRLALESVLNQTYKNIEVIIGDDSTSNETEDLVREFYINNYSNIIYYHNEKNLGQFDNDLKLMDISNGNFVNYLMDDDLFELTKIEKMMNYFIEDINEEISLVTSHRAIIDKEDKVKEIFGNTSEIFNKDTVIDGIKLGNFMLKFNFNCIGEPTTVLFRKNKLLEPFGIYNGRRYGCNVDQATWFNLLSNGKAAFINEVLSFFRIHEDQQLASDKMKILGAIDYAHEVLTGKKKGFLIKSDDFKLALNKSVMYCNSIIDCLTNLDNEKLYTEELKMLKKYSESLHEQIAKYDKDVKSAFLIRRLDFNIDIEKTICLIIKYIKDGLIDYSEIINIVTRYIVNKVNVLNFISRKCFEHELVEDGIQLLNSAYNISPHDFDTNYNLAYILILQDKKELAMNYLNNLEGSSRKIDELKVMIGERIDEK